MEEEIMREGNLDEKVKFSVDGEMQIRKMGTKKEGQR